MRNLKRILILGASGFIGKALSLRLSDQYEVVAFSRKSDSELTKVNNIRAVTGNFSTIEDFRELLTNVACVIHLISTTVPGDDTSNIPKEIEENVIPTVKLLEDMVRYGVPKIIFASSAGTVYGETGEKINNIHSSLNPHCSYGVQKVVIEEYLKFYGLRYGLDYRIVRISNPYGLGQDSKKPQGLIPILIRKLENKEAITVFGNGNNIRDYIFLPDLIDGITSVIRYDGQERIFNLGFGKYYSICDVIKMVEDVENKKFVSIHESAERFCDVHQSLVDMNESHIKLKWFPQTDLKEGITLTLQAMP